MKQKLQSVFNLMRAQGPERDVPKHWLLRTGSRLDRRFQASAHYSFSDRGDCLQVTVGDQIFLWPSSAPKSTILQILSEILTPEHPHQYLYGPTGISADDVVLDIGACEGAFSAFVTARCIHVIAVEPSHSMCALMARLFELRKEPCPEIFNCLLGGESSKAYFVENESNPGASCICSEPAPNAYELPVMTLDEAVAKMRYKPTFIKCDAEGAEPAIFSGGKRFLCECHPKLAITTYHNDGDFAHLHTLLKSFGYNVRGKGFLLSNGVLRVQMIHAW